MRPGCISKKRLTVYDKPKTQIKLFRRLAAEDHSVQEYLKIVHNAAELRVDLKGKRDLRFILAYN